MSIWKRSTGRLLVQAGAALVVGFGLAACGGESKAVPNVVGMQLDEAHRKLEAVGFEKFDDRDRFEDRSVFRDANWVVLKQDPAAGESVKTGTEIELEVGKIGEKRTTEALPEGSPVLERLRAEAAEQERERAEEAAKEEDRKRREAERAADEAREQAAAKARAAKEYVDKIDPALRLAVTNHVELGKLKNEVARGEVSGYALEQNVAAATSTLGSLETLISLAQPGKEAGLSREHDQLAASVQGFRRAALTLLSADGSDAKAALRRFDDVYEEAVGDWNASVTSSYAVAAISDPPVVK